jgi:hypothetical protein
MSLQVYSDTHIDVFDTLSGDWVQTINIRKTRPLIKTGQINLSMLQELPHVTYLSNVNKGWDRGQVPFLYTWAQCYVMFFNSPEKIVDFDRVKLRQNAATNVCIYAENIIITLLFKKMSTSCRKIGLNCPK